jgi:membrane-associated PAP2 superfamily phosphatase
LKEVKPDKTKVYEMFDPLKGREGARGCWAGGHAAAQVVIMIITCAIIFT